MFNLTHLRKYENTNDNTRSGYHKCSKSGERKTVLPHKLNLTSKPQHTHTLGQILATRHIKGGNTKCTKQYTKAKWTCVRIKNMQNITAGTRIWKKEKKKRKRNVAGRSQTGKHMYIININIIITGKHDWANN